MSTQERDVAPADAPPLSTSLALVPLAGDRVPPRAEPAGTGPLQVHRLFYGLGYTALGLMLIGAWLQTGFGAEAMFALAALGLAVAGLGVLAYTAYRPSVKKLRMMLGAVASLALTVAAVGPVHNASDEVHASAQIARLQPLAEDLARDGRIRSIGIPRDGWVELNGIQGALDGSAAQVVDGREVHLAEVLERDGISRLDLVRLLRRLREAGVRRVQTGEAYVAFESRNAAHLLYLRPGHPLPPPGIYILDHAYWRTRPMGGGWYMQATPRRI